MKSSLPFLLILVLLLLFDLPELHAQESVPSQPPDSSQSTPATPSPGPGVPLPPHSQSTKVDLTGLQTNAISFTDRIRQPAMELFSFLAILALVWTGYHAQFRGLQEFVGTLLAIIITSALIAKYKTMIPIIFESRRQLQAALSNNDFIFMKQLGGILSTVGASLTVMSLSGVALGVGLFLIVIVAALIYATQLLFEAVLIAFGPLAIASLAFQHTRGIFTFWFKSLIAVVLIPVGWSLGAKFIGGALTGTSGVQDLLATIVYVVMYGAIFMGMPFATLKVVNAAGGVAASAMPSFLAAATSFMGGRGSILPQASGSGLHSITAATSSAGVASNVSSTISTTLSTSAASRSPDVMSQRVSDAQRWHQQIQSSLSTSSKS